MSIQISPFKIRMKFLIIGFVAVCFIVGLCNRVFAFTSAPNDIAFCTVSPITSSTWYNWKCWTNSDINSYVTNIINSQGGIGVQLVYDDPNLFEKMFLPQSAFASVPTASYVSPNTTTTANIPYNNLQSNPSRTDWLISLSINLPTGLVLVGPIENSKGAVLNIADYMAKNSELSAVQNQNTCMSNICNGSVTSVGDTMTCNATSGCTGKTPMCVETCSGKADLFFSGSTAWSSHCSTSGSGHGASTAELNNYCNNLFANSAAANTSAIANKATDDPASKASLGQGIGKDASSGVTGGGSAPSGSITTGAPNGSQGVSPNSADARNMADNINGNCSSTQSCIQGAVYLAEVNYGAAKSTDFKNDQSYVRNIPIAPYRAPIDASVGTGFQSGLSTAFTAFITNMKTTSLYHLGNGFFNGIPAGAYGSVTINGGNTFGVAHVDMAQYASFFSKLSPVFIAICSFIALKILIIKGGSG